MNAKIMRFSTEQQAVELSFLLGQFKLPRATKGWKGMYATH